MFKQLNSLTDDEVWTLDVTVKSQVVCECEDERESVQKKTFAKWVNSHLMRVTCSIQDLYVDLRDGKMLIKLLEVLSGERLVRSLLTADAVLWIKYVGLVLM